VGEHESERERANRLAIVGSVFLAPAMTAVVFPITDVLFSVPWASLVTAIVAGAFALVWYGLPLWRELRRG